MVFLCVVRRNKQYVYVSHYYDFDSIHVFELWFGLICRVIPSLSHYYTWEYVNSMYNREKTIGMSEIINRAKLLMIFYYY